jgi:hypothetical protein
MAKGKIIAAVCEVCGMRDVTVPVYRDETHFF